MDHIRQFRCTYSACQYPPFVSAQALRGHVAKHHESITARKSIRIVGRLPMRSYGSSGSAATQVQNDSPDVYVMNVPRSFDLEYALDEALKEEERRKEKADKGLDKISGLFVAPKPTEKSNVIQTADSLSTRNTGPKLSLSPTTSGTADQSSSRATTYPGLVRPHAITKIPNLNADQKSRFYAAVEQWWSVIDSSEDRKPRNTKRP